jgi:predicted RNase H-like HicB family nuclease
MDFVVLTCVAHGRGENWEAYCLDLDLAVHGSSPGEVRARLEEAIEGYIAAATDEAEPARSRLLNRRAPLYVRLRWALRILLDAIFGKKPDHESVVGFQVPCRA